MPRSWNQVGPKVVFVSKYLKENKGKFPKTQKMEPLGITWLSKHSHNIDLNLTKQNELRFIIS